MDIAFVSDVVYPFVSGGAQKRIHEIGRRLSSKGHSVTVYGRHWWDGPPVVERNGMTLWGISNSRSLYTGNRRSIPEAVEFAIAVVHQLRRRLSDHDIVIASQFPYFPAIAAKSVTHRSETPLVITWHEVWGDYWWEYLGPLAVGGKVVEGVTARLPHVPVAVSNVTANQLAEIGPDRSAIEVVYNGVDLDRIKNISAATDGYEVLFVGRLIPDKNVDVLLNAFDRVTDQFDATLGIIGDGPERAALEHRATNLAYSDRVTFLGRLESHDRVLAHMHAADTFVSPSTREGFGITFVEAMATGCTVVAVDHPRSTASEVVGKAGLLTPLTVEDVAAAMSRALSGERPHHDPLEVVKRYDWDRIADHASQVYTTAVRTAHE